MRERSLDEFESIFEQASIPVLDIREAALTRISVVLAGSALDVSILALAGDLQKRFDSEVRVLPPAGVDLSEARTTAGKHGFAIGDETYASNVDLVRQVRGSQTHLVLLGDPEDVGALGFELDLDALVEDTDPPILIIRKAIEDPTVVFTKILHSLTGNFQQTQNFTHSFTLVTDKGELLLLHVISDDQVDDVRETLQVSPEIADRTGGRLLANLAHHGERYLKAVVAASRKEPFDVRYRLAVGDVVATVRRELASGRYSLLVVGSHLEGRSEVSASDYRLMHQVRDVPVLAL
jgi:hypothetical protein